jgi:hypothetical protein
MPAFKLLAASRPDLPCSRLKVPNRRARGHCGVNPERRTTSRHIAVSLAAKAAASAGVLEKRRAPAVRNRFCVAAPTEMTWLNLHEAKQIGIEVLPFEEQTPATKPAPPVTSREASNQEISSRARLFVKEINSRLSRINAAEWVGQLYADEVISYGKLRSRREIVTEHRLYTEQWPERSYSIQDKSMNAVCGESGPGPAQPVPQVPVECIVTGTMEWKGREAR